MDDRPYPDSATSDTPQPRSGSPSSRVAQASRLFGSASRRVVHRAEGNHEKPNRSGWVDRRAGRPPEQAGRLCYPRSAVLRFVILLLLAVPAFAVDLPAIHLDTINPPGGQIGTEVQVNLTGSDLDDANALLFSHPGLAATPSEKNFVIKIADDVPEGVYDVRVSGLHGVSNPRAFAVGHLPPAKVKVGAQLEAAGDLPIDTVTFGSVTAAAASYFKFTAKQSQRLLVECLAAEIDSKFNPMLTVLDSNGHELEVNHRGGLLDFTPPAEGSYLLRIHDLAFGGGPTHFYRLAITTGPHIDFIFPPIGAPGATGKFTVYGRNLPGGVPANLTTADGKPLEKLETEIVIPTAAETRMDGPLLPAAAAIEGFPWRLKTPQGASNPVYISLASGPPVSEQEPNDKPAAAQKITPPCEIAGQFYPANDVDTFAFNAKKDEVWTIEAISHRLGVSTSPFLLVQRDGGEAQEAYRVDPTVAEKRFISTSNDPTLRLQVKEDGVYRVSIRDLFGAARRDPANVYRLSIRKETPDFRLAAVYEPLPEKATDRTATPSAPTLRGGGTIGIKVVAFRRDNFTGDIDLSAEGLPTGVTCGPTKLPAGKNEGVLLLTAIENPEAWSGSLRILGRAKIGATDVTHEARGGTVRFANSDFDIDAVQSRLARDFALAVRPENTPVSIAPAEDKVWEVAAGSKPELPLKITRRGEFKDALKLKPVGAPGLETLKEFDINAKAEITPAVLDLTTAKLAPGPYTIYFQGQTKGKFRGKDVVTTFYSAPIRLLVQPPAAPEKK